MMAILTEILIYIIAAFFEILGCFAFWQFFKNSKNFIWLGVGVVALIIFAYTLTKVQSEFAGRAYAAYGGIYIICSLLWLNFIEKQNFNKFDLIGALIALIGACVIIYPNLR